MKAVIDTNVLLVANEQHSDVSPECIETCIKILMRMKESGVTVIDDSYLILKEYRNKTSTTPEKGVGDVFLKHLLQNKSNVARVVQVQITEVAEHFFTEFPDINIESQFDGPDRKFIAVSNAHPDKPEVWQAADCKWLDWSQTLEDCGLRIKFLCPNDICKFYQKKFPGKAVPSLPN